MIAAARLLAARLHLCALGLAHAGSTSALLTIASARRPSLSVSQLLAEPAGHRVTLRRPRLLRSPLVIRTNPNPSHADALRDLRYQYASVTGGSAYLPQRGDSITHEVTK